MKTYEVTRGTSGQIGVLVKTGDGQHATLLKHCVYHSPTGFETGYGGSGPSDLALSILTDYFGLTPKQVNPQCLPSSVPRADDAFRVLALHHAFKDRFIAPKKLDPGQSYEILGAEIASWIGDIERPRPEPE